ncbi:MAG: glycosyltransferase family 39 protein [Deltaproteobacteria bacterium]|nr:glycosyltransferase family 39 protein [Deltaproteobacteria bacterium]
MKDFLNKEKKWLIPILSAILALGVFLRVYRAGRQSLWTDEISSAMISSSPIHEIISRNLSPDKADIPVEEPPFPYILMHYSMAAGGENEFFARLPAIVFGILGIYAVFLAAAELFGKRAGILSAFLISISLYHILYSQEARGYSAHVFWSMLTLFYLWRAMRGGGRRNWAGFAAATIFNAYSHYSAFQVAAAEALIFFLFGLVFPCARADGGIKERKRPLKIFVICVAAALVAAAPLLKNFLGVMDRRLGGGTIAFELNPAYFENLLSRYGAGSGIAFYIYNVFFILGIYGAFKYGKRKEATALLIWLIFPFVVLKFTGYKYFFHIRYVIFTFPAYLILVANGAAGLYDILASRFSSFFERRGQYGYGALLASVFTYLSIAPLSLYYEMPARMTDWKGVASYIKARYRPGTVILAESAFVLRELGYYLRDAGYMIQPKSVRADEGKFMEAVLSNPSVWYVDANPVFDNIVGRLFKSKVVFSSPVFESLGRQGLIDWDNSWFPPSNIRRYYPTLYYNNINRLSENGATADEGAKHLITREKTRGFNRRDILTADGLDIKCFNCAYAVKSFNGRKVLEAYFDGGPDEDEHVDISLPVLSPVGLSDFPVLEVTYKTGDESVQTIEAIAGIDYTGDGVEDGSVSFLSEPGVNTSDADGGFRFISAALFKEAVKSSPKAGVYSLTSLKIRAGKRRGSDLRGKGKSYGFEFRDIEAFGTHRRLLFDAAGEGLYEFAALVEAVGPGQKSRGIWFKGVTSAQGASMGCINCVLEVLSAGGTPALTPFFDGGPEEDEYAEITLPVRAPVDLSEFPVFEVTYRIEDEAAQGIEAVAGIDYTGDGVEDGSVSFFSEPGVNVSDAGGGFKFISVGIFKEAEKVYPDRYSYLLTSLKLRARKRLGVDLSLMGRARRYAFEFKDIEVFSSASNPEFQRDEIIYNSGYKWSSEPSAIKYTAMDNDRGMFVTGFFREDLCSAQAISFYAPIRAWLDEYDEFVMPVEAETALKQSLNLDFHIATDGDGAGGAIVKKTFKGNGIVRLNLKDAAGALHGGHSRPLLTGLKAEFVYMPCSYTDSGEAFIRNDETEVKAGAHYWRFGSIRLVSSERQRIPEGIYIESDGVKYPMTQGQGMGDGPGLQWFTAGKVRLKKGMNIIRIKDDFEGKGEIRLIEVESRGKGRTDARTYSVY